MTPRGVDKYFDYEIGSSKQKSDVAGICGKKLYLRHLCKTFLISIRICFLSKAQIT